ncbi:metacaspase-1-like isoform X2 [Camellia sinensis]|uniref:metacaspase-1-like isoform X2 n=1 Tax=Camellia sinensis TaxID=4442 RepID=UPI0010369407|nr:metacaspase-1-like isoform X2 [Camellia sinensis]
MNTREISCGSCHNKILETPDSKNTVCQSCESLISTEACETVPKGHLSFCWKTRLQENKSLHAALPKPDQKLNPMTNNIGVHLPKRAVLCGVSYQKKKHKLKGTTNDVKRMKSLLTDHFGFLETSICVLTEEEDDPNLIPTKENMQKALRWLVADCKSGDSLVFYFSGHGLRQPDFDMDENDDYDETICPSDFMTAGMILDNDINNTIVKPLKEGVKLHAIIDACHSGTILDLEHVYDRKHHRFRARKHGCGYEYGTGTSAGTPIRQNSKKVRYGKWWVDNKPTSGVRKSTDGGLAISLSACGDDQIAADTTAFSRNEMTGAMTYIFDQIIRQNPTITYSNLLEKMHEQIKHANSNSTGCLLRIFCHKLIQAI